MPSKSVESAVGKIRKMKIQGSSAVRKKVVAVLKAGVRGSRAQTIRALRKELERNAAALLHARPTEPETRTAIRIILKSASLETQNLQELKDHVLGVIERYEDDRAKAMQTIATYGARLIEKGDVIFTHCHSHTVEEIFKKAKKKIEMVYCTETRPLYQGRITAANLVKLGIPVTLIVDSAADSFMHFADKLFTGCDAVLSDGSIVNKVGTAQLAMIAKKHHVPYFVATSSHCFDPLTYLGFEEKIEERDWKEVWERKPKRIRIRNPAFDVTSDFYIQAIITELGVFDPNMFALEMYQKLELGKRQQEFLSLLKLMRPTK